MGTISKAMPSNLSLVERLKQKKSNPCLLLDLSSSMNEDCEPGRAKIQALTEIVRGLKNNPTIIAFNDTAWETDKNAKFIGKYGTNMSTAIELAKRLHHHAAIMITDGEANDKERVLEAVKNFNLRILYVGPGPKPSFLDDLANAGGSTCTLEDLTMPAELEGKLQLLLGEGKKEKGVIEL